MVYSYETLVMGLEHSRKEEHSSRLTKALGSSPRTTEKGGREGGQKADVIRKSTMCFANKSIIKGNEMKT